MSSSHLLKADSPNLMIYRPGINTEYLLVKDGHQLYANRSVQGNDGVFVVNMFIKNDESKRVCAIVHKDTGLCVTSTNNEGNICMKDNIVDLNHQAVNLGPEDDRFFYITSYKEHWLFRAMAKPDTYLTIENGKVVLVHSLDPAKDLPGAFLKIVNPDKH